MGAMDEMVNPLFYVRSRKAREAGYESIAKQYGQRFAENVRDQVESHHLLVENERAAMRHPKPRAVT
jgi:hypothetical protein